MSGTPERKGEAMTAHSSVAEAAIRQRIPIPIRLKDGTYRMAEMITFSDLCDRREHLAILLPGWDKATVPLVRVHSECLTGDVFGSGRCDCGPQLEESLMWLSKEGGILMYLRQEGRGIGLYNKLDAYALQDAGLDTFEANRALNFKNDQRDYHPVSQMLAALGVSAVRLITNNPDKLGQLKQLGVRVVERMSTGVYFTSHNIRYLQAKREKGGHFLDLASAALQLAEPCHRPSPSDPGDQPAPALHNDPARGAGFAKPTDVSQEG
jgi:GTP cyclohydrolase II